MGRYVAGACCCYKSNENIVYLFLTNMIYINVLHQIDPTMKLIIIKSFIRAYTYSKDKYKSFNSHPKYHSYYSLLECNNSIKNAYDPSGGSVPLGTIVMLLSRLSRLGTSTTTIGRNALGS
jgi:hypothetical protein